MQFFQKSVQELITQTSTNLPPDVRQAMAAAITSEQPSTKSSQALAVIAHYPRGRLPSLEFEGHISYLKCGYHARNRGVNGNGHGFVALGHCFHFCLVTD